MAKRDFYTGSVRIIGDARPSGLDHRVYACVSMHDGMSLKKDSGRGCYATFATLTAAIGCDASNLSKSLKRLVEWGYLTEERQVDRRRKTYRVVFDFPEGWRNDQQSIDGELANDLAEIVGQSDSESGGNPPLDAQHYSSLKGLDSLKEKLNSSEEARLATRHPYKLDYADNPVAQMANLERALRDGRRVNCLAWSEYLSSLHESDDNAVRGQADRLADLVIEAMSPAEYEQWGRDHGWVDEAGRWDVAHPRGEAA
jgi:hypothetical protein